MGKVCYRFFGGLIAAQERWLNEMAAKGWRLVRCGKASYEFEEAEPGQVQYCIEFVGQKSRESAQDYKEFLEEMGYRVFYKNINWDYSAGKVTWRPWAEKGGRIASQATTLHRELLIVEKENDGRPFALHTTYEDKMALCRTMAKPWLWTALLFAGGGALARMPAFVIFGLLALLPALSYGLEGRRLKAAAQTSEWDGTAPAKKGNGLRAAACLAVLAVAVGAAVVLPGRGHSFFGSRIGWVEHTEADVWSARYSYFNGRCSKTLRPGTEPAVLHIEIVTEKGTLALRLEDAGGNVLLEESGLMDAVFDVAVSGPVTARLEADGHTGSFRLEW